MSYSFFRWFLLHGFGSRRIPFLFSFFALVFFFVLFSSVCLPVVLFGERLLLVFFFCFFPLVVPSKQFFFALLVFVHIYNGHKYTQNISLTRVSRESTYYTEHIRPYATLQHTQRVYLCIDGCHSIIVWASAMAVVIKRSIIPFAITHIFFSFFLFLPFEYYIRPCTHTHTHITPNNIIQAIYTPRFPRCRI